MNRGWVTIEFLRYTDRRFVQRLGPRLWKWPMAKDNRVTVNRITRKRHPEHPGVYWFDEVEAQCV
jgi:hypothetical protein